MYESKYGKYQSIWTTDVKGKKGKIMFDETDLNKVKNFGPLKFNQLTKLKTEDDKNGVTKLKFNRLSKISNVDPVVELLFNDIQV